MMQPMTTSGASREAELLGAEQTGDGDIAAGLELPIGLNHDAVAQLVGHQRLLRLGQPSSHGAPGYLIEVIGLAPVPPS